MEPLFEQIQHEEVQYPDGLELSAAVSSILRGLFTKDPEHRSCLPELLEHEWVAEAKREEDQHKQEQADGQEGVDASSASN